MAIITYEQIAVSLGRPISGELEQAQVTQWIADAETLIRLRLGDLAELDQDALKYVLREAVISKIRNPDGVQSEQIDDYTYRRFESGGAGQVFITAEWWDLLTPDQARDGAFTITPHSAPGYRLNPLDGWA